MSDREAQPSDRKSKSRRKYEQGEQITSLDELAQQEFIIVHGKVYHRGWFLSWSFWLAKNYMIRGIYKAARKEVERSDER